MRNPIKIVRTKYYEHRTELVAGTAFVAGVAATLYCVKGYNPNKPIPGLLMTERDLLKNVGASVVAVEYLKERGLSEDFVGYAKNFIETNKDTIAETKSKLVSELILENM
jgi:hypothetical protein